MEANLYYNRLLQMKRRDGHGTQTGHKPDTAPPENLGQNVQISHEQLMRSLPDLIYEKLN